MKMSTNKHTSHITHTHTHTHTHTLPDLQSILFLVAQHDRVVRPQSRKVVVVQVEQIVFLKRVFDSVK